jgi:hypothetical protein
MVLAPLIPFHGVEILPDLPVFVEDTQLYNSPLMN